MEQQPSGPALTPTRKSSLTEDVADKLREAILQERFTPSQSLPEEQLAAMLGVSRGPVRLALRQLEREGLVIVRPRRGATVARLSMSDLEEAYSLRMALERLAAERAARLATEEDFAAMEAVLKAFEVALSLSPSERQEAELDLRFHDLIFHAARHQRLLDSWTTLRSQIYICLLSRNVADSNYLSITVSGHALILEALRARDERKAVQVIEEHIRDGHGRILKAQAARNRADGKAQAGIGQVQEQAQT